MVRQAAAVAGTGEAGMIYRPMKRNAEVWEDVVSLKSRTIPFTNRLLLLALFVALDACTKSDKPSAKVFPSPDDASNAMLAAAQSGDRDAILAIFGPDAKEIISSGDAVEDKNVAAAFAAKYGEMHRWRELSDGGQVLVVGTDNFSFPVPLRKNDGGQWFFDTAAGKDEILSRRIGRNELAIIEVCRTAADAQAEYFSQLHDGETTKQYAMKFLSDPGKHNGLYWESPEGQTASPLPNGQLATLSLQNLSSRDKFRFHPRVKLRYDTTAAQMRSILEDLRRLLAQHPRVDRGSVYVRFLQFGDSSLEIDVFAYVMTRSRLEFLEVQEDLLLEIMEIVETAGAQIALQSPVYVAPTAVPSVGRATPFEALSPAP